MDDFIKTRPPVAVEAVTEYLERVAQLKVTGVLDKLGKQARFLGSFITKVHGGYTIQTDTETFFAGLPDLNLVAHRRINCLVEITTRHTILIKTQVVLSSGSTIPLLKCTSWRFCIFI